MALLLTGNEAVARAARAAGYHLGTGYPGTPSSEICDAFSELGGHARWAPNEKVAAEVGIGVAFGGGRCFVTMKHVGVNVAADPLFSMAYTGTVGAFVMVVGDDPGLASSQNEQDTRRYGVAAGVPVVEPGDSQQAFDFFLEATALSERFGTPVIMRLTTRVCHSRTLVEIDDRPSAATLPPAKPAHFARDFRQLVVLPGNARRLHRELREKLSRIAVAGEHCPLNRIHEPAADGDNAADGDGAVRDGVGVAAIGWDDRNATRAPLGVIATGVAAMHVLEADPKVRVLQLGLSYPVPTGLLRRFLATVDRALVVEENDPVVHEQILAAGDLRTAAGRRVEGRVPDGRPDIWRFGELNVGRVRRLLAGRTEDEAPPAPGKPPELCPGCPHRVVFETLRDLDCIVCGDIGCYTLGALTPFNAIDTCLCMGAGVGMGLGLRHRLPVEEARRVVSVIGDSTFVHSGLTGLAEMAYNRPPTGHVVILLDNGTTAMTGLQEHPGTGYSLDRKKTGARVDYAAVAKALGIEDVVELDMADHSDAFPDLMRDRLAADRTTLIITRRPCVLAAKFLMSRDAWNA